MAVGGSTNAVLHLLAIAHEARVELTSPTSTASAAGPPHRRLRPHGRFLMSDIDRVGGIPVVMRMLLDAGLLHGDCLTVTGKTVAENLAELGDIPAPTATSSGRSTTRSTPTAGSPSCTARWPPKGAIVKVAGSTTCASRAPPGSSTARRRDGLRAGRQARRRRRHRHPLRGPQGRARGCARCSPSPPR
jgi:dihydroxy-acid dehydratase